VGSLQIEVKVPLTPPPGQLRRLTPPPLPCSNLKVQSARGPPPPPSTPHPLTPTNLGKFADSTSPLRTLTYVIATYPIMFMSLPMSMQKESKGGPPPPSLLLLAFAHPPTPTSAMNLV